jgi:hypothetical protein
VGAALAELADRLPRGAALNLPGRGVDSAAIGHPLFDVGEFASYLTAAGEDEADYRRSASSVITAS